MLDEPLFMHIFRDTAPARTVRATTPWFRTFLRTFAPDGEVHTARVDGRLAGVGSRMRPGAYPLHGARKARFTLSVLSSLLRMIAASRAARHRTMRREPGAASAKGADERPAGDD